MKNFLLDAQLQVYQPSSQEYINRINALKINSTEIRRLMADGEEKFKLSWVKRILQTQADKIVFNRCKICGGLARTPQAKQCRFCGNQWHNE
jgi:formylmethanofuran dehydrogenase subunit E